MPRRYYYYAGFGEDANASMNVMDPGGGLVVTSGKAAFYRLSDPVTAFVSVLQKALGVPTTGVWDPTTQAALWNWVMVREVMNTGTSDLPATIPWNPLICASDGFPIEATSTETLAKHSTMESPADCIETTAAVMESLDHYARNNPAFLASLGWASVDAMEADEDWRVAKDSIGIALAAHIRSQLMAEDVEPPPPPGEEPPPPPGDELPPLPVVVPPGVPATKSAGVGWILGGLLAVGLVGWLLMRKAEPTSKSMPRP